MMKPTRLISVVLMLGAAALAAPPATAPTTGPATAPAVSPEAQRLYRAFLEQPDTPHRTESDPAYQALFKDPDGDLCFRHALAEPREGLRRIAIRAVGTIRSRRIKDCALDILADKSSNAYARMSAVTLLPWGDKQSSPNSVRLLLDLLARDPDPRVRATVATAVGNFADPAIVPALLAAFEKDTDPSVKIAALKGLANHQSDKCVEPALTLLRTSKTWYEHNDGISVLTLYTYNCQRWRKETSDPVPDALAILKNSALPFDLWLLERLQRNLFTDATAKPPDLPFTSTAGDLKLTATLDADTYRPGEPIRLHIRFENTSDKQARVPFPRLDGRWRDPEGIAFEIKNLATGKPLKLPLRHWGGGSYAHPGCERLAPHESFQHIRCLQRVVTGGDWFTLPPGDYSLIFTTDFTGLTLGDDQGLITKWAAPPVRFTVKGDPVKDPKDLIALIARKCGIPDIAGDMYSHNSRRWSYAWWSLGQFASDDLYKFLRETHAEHYANEGISQPIQWDP